MKIGLTAKEVSEIRAELAKRIGTHRISGANYDKMGEGMIEVDKIIYDKLLSKLHSKNKKGAEA